MPNAKTLKDVKEYLDKDYWEKGNKSGYKDIYLNLWWNGRWCQCFNRAIPLYDKRLLDLGCGIGGFVTMALLFGADAYGVDLSSYAIKKYKEEASRLKLPNERCFEGSCHDLSRWPDESFDIVYSNQVFEHVPENLTENMVREIYRVAKKGACLWFALQMPEDGQHVRGANDPDETHITLYEPAWWNKKFKDAGFLEDKKTDELLRSIVTGYDHYSFFKEYGWTTLTYKKEA